MKHFSIFSIPLFLLLCSIGHAEQPALSDIGKIKLAVNVNGNGDLRVDRALFQQGIEKRLRGAHISFTTGTEDADSLLDINMGISHGKANTTYIADLTISVVRQALIPRNPNQSFVAGIWDTGLVGPIVGTNVSDLSDFVFPDLDKFISAYAAANPGMHIVGPSRAAPAPVSPMPSAPPSETPAPGGDTPAPSPAPETSRSSNPVVWVNLPNGIYHYSTSKWYGKTKRGKYLHEDEALRAGYRAAKNEK